MTNAEFNFDAPASVLAAHSAKERNAAETSPGIEALEGIADISSYDLILVNSSGGKDSAAMTAHLVDLVDLLGVPRERLVMVHADLGRAEWKGTTETVEAHAGRYGMRLEIVRRKVNDLLDHVKARGKWPGSTTRFCTSEHKRGPISTVMTKLANEFHGSTRGKVERPVRILNCLGIRSAESPARAKKPAFENDKRNTNGRRHVDTWFPIHDWSVESVWSKIKSAGLEIHKAYGLGMPRLSCAFCVFAGKNALMLAGKENPDLLEEYVAVEEEIGHDFTAAFPIREIKEALDRGEEPGEIKTWEM